MSIDRADAPTRVIALGASNLTRALYTVVSTARTAWTRDIEFVGALGLGRSYGIPSAILGRSLPGILESGLWAAVDAMPAAPSVGLITDVGNDIMYNVEVPQILAWVAECVNRLERHAHTIVISGLPVEGERQLSDWQFRWLRHVLVPSCRLTHDQLRQRAAQVNAGLRQLAEERGHRFEPLDSAWYGLDPIHIRSRFWRAAWSRILGAPSDLAWTTSWPELIHLHTQRPEREWFFGVERRRRQEGVRLRHGGRVWLF